VKSTGTLLLAFLCASVCLAQNASAPAARTDVYHVHFAKATLGKGAEEGDFLKQPDPKAPMPGHLIVLRHQDGEDWDYEPSNILEPKPPLLPLAIQRPLGHAT